MDSLLGDLGYSLGNSSTWFDAVSEVADKYDLEPNTLSDIGSKFRALVNNPKELEKPLDSQEVGTSVRDACKPGISPGSMGIAGAGQALQQLKPGESFTPGSIKELVGDAVSDVMKMLTQARESGNPAEAIFAALLILMKFVIQFGLLIKGEITQGATNFINTVSEFAK